MGKTRITIQDVAEVAGSDRGTVSRVLRGLGPKFKISASRAELIRQTAARLQYRPSVSALAIRTGRFHMVGVVISTDVTGFFLPHPVLAGIHDALAQRGDNLIVVRVGEATPAAESANRLLTHTMVDGLLLAFPPFGPLPAVAQQFEIPHLPTIWLYRPRQQDCVYVDNAGGGRQAVNYLYEQGHRRIAYLNDYATAPDPTPDEYDHRCAGYRQQMLQLGLVPDEIHIPREVAGPLVPYLAQRLAATARPTALICNPNQAEQVLLAATLAGRSVPRDLSLLQFQNLDPTVRDNPVTALAIDQYQRSKIAVELLAQKIAQPAQPLPPCVITMQLMPGQTTGPAPA